MGRGSSKAAATSKTAGLTVYGENILEAAREYTKQYKYVGIRTQEEPFELGYIEHQSHTWRNGDDTGKKIGGISVTSIRSEAIAAHSDIKENFSKLRQFKNNGYYYGDNVAIVVSNSARRGYDVGELILENPKVVKIFRKRRS